MIPLSSICQRGHIGTNICLNTLTPKSQKKYLNAYNSGRECVVLFPSCLPLLYPLFFLFPFLPSVSPLLSPFCLNSLPFTLAMTSKHYSLFNLFMELQR